MPLNEQQIEEVIDTIWPSSQSGKNVSTQRDLLSSPTSHTFEQRAVKLRKLMSDPPVPLCDPKIDEQKLKAWVNLHKDEEQAIAEKIANNIRYINFDEFYGALKKCAAALNKKYEEEKVQGEDVIIAVPFLYGKYSSSWIVSLLLRELNFKPLTILECLSQTTQLFLEENSNVKRIIIIQNPSTSNEIRHFSYSIAQKIDKERVKFDFLIPYPTNLLKTVMQNLGVVYSHQILPVLSELPFTERERKLLAKWQLSTLKHESRDKKTYKTISFENLSICYFAHHLGENAKIADKILRFGYPLAEFMPDELRNSLLNSTLFPNTSSLNPYQPFIPEFTPCYEPNAITIPLSEYQKRRPIIQRADELRKQTASQQLLSRLSLSGAIVVTAGLTWHYGWLAVLTYLTLGALIASLAAVTIYGILNIKSLFTELKHPILATKKIVDWCKEKIKLSKSEQLRYGIAYIHEASKYSDFKQRVGPAFHTYLEKIQSQVSAAKFKDEIMQPLARPNELQAVRWKCRQFERLIGKGKLSKHTAKEIIDKLATLDPKAKAEKIKIKYPWKQ